MKAVFNLAGRKIPIEDIAKYATDVAKEAGAGPDSPLAAAIFLRLSIDKIGARLTGEAPQSLFEMIFGKP